MKQVRSYDLETGKLLWYGAGTTMNPIPSPVAADGMVILTAGFRGNNLKAVRLADAKDDITNTPALVWTLDRDTPYVPSPLLYDGILYLLKSNNGILSVFDAKTGKPHYQADPPRSGAQHLRLARRRGRAGSTSPARTARPSSSSTARRSRSWRRTSSTTASTPPRRWSMASLYLRGFKSLYCIAEK